MKKEIWQKNHQLGHYHTHGDSHYPRHYLVHRDNELKRGLVSWSVGQFIFTLSTTALFLFHKKAPTSHILIGVIFHIPSKKKNMRRRYKFRLRILVRMR